MSVRIRYNKSPDGTLISKVFKTPTDEVVVNIKPDGTFVICNLKGELVANSESGPQTLHSAKKSVKKSLQALNVPFESEVRPRLKEMDNKE